MQAADASSSERRRRKYRAAQRDSERVSNKRGKEPEELGNRSGREGLACRDGCGCRMSENLVLEQLSRGIIGRGCGVLAHGEILGRDDCGWRFISYFDSEGDNRDW